MDIQWMDDTKCILMQVLPETWEWDDYSIAMGKLRQMLEAVDHEVCIIIDASNVNLLPKGFMIYFNEGHQNLPAHVKMRILVSRKWAMRTVASFLIKVVPRNFQNFFCASTLEEAHKLIEEAEKKPVEEIDAACA
jgi:hypothetical protein